ncbi:iron-containing alcohol dehydrogenase [Bacillus licheniformis]|nr:iron-containing alcohol dehydrogenase [Bacillus licheniformis]
MFAQPYCRNRPYKILKTYLEASVRNDTTFSSESAEAAFWTERKYCPCCKRIQKGRGAARDRFGRKPGIPTVLIPSTSGTGAEVTPNAIVTLPEEELKVGIVSPLLCRNLSFLTRSSPLDCQTDYGGYRNGCIHSFA